LHGILRYALDREFDVAKLMSQVAGRAIEPREWDQWLAELPEAKRREVEKKLADERFAARQPMFDNYFDDYREAAPGFWVPWRYGYTIFEQDSGESYAASRRDLRIVDFEINPKLSDELFEIEVNEGVRMVDWRYEPP